VARVTRHVLALCAALQVFVGTALLGLGACSGTTATARRCRKHDLPAASHVRDLEHLGTVTLAAGTSFAGTKFGGISGLTYDAARARYYALSDDRSQHAPARFYTLTIDLGDGRLDAGDVVITDVTTLRDASGAPFPALSLDPEGIALAPSGTTVWVSSEGDADAAVAPFVREFRLSDGRQVRALPLPARCLPAPTRGIRQNLAFESLALTPDGRYLVTGTENALQQDGPACGITDASLSRILFYDLARAVLVREVVYRVEPVPTPPVPPGSFANNGLVELLATDGAGTFLALERAFSTGVGTDVRLYEVRTQSALDVQGIEALAGGGAPFDVGRAVAKRELLNIGALGIVPDDLEALTFGPSLSRGRRLLILASDDNFNAAQVTQFLAFAVRFEESPAVTCRAQRPPSRRSGPRRPRRRPTGASRSPREARRATGS
jgi:hypothetical protein